MIILNCLPNCYMKTKKQNPIMSDINIHTNNDDIIDDSLKKCNQIKSKPITHVIFDLDGLILDTEFVYEQATKRIVQNYGKTFTLEDKLKVLGRPGSVVAQMLIEDMQLPLTVDEFMLKFDEEYTKLANEQPVPLMPGAERLIRHLHRFKIPIAIATGSRRFTYDLNTKHQRLLFNLFNHVLLSSDDPEVTRGKPDPQPFIVCAKRFVPSPQSHSNILVFEDSLVGIESANRAGMTTVWIPDYRFSRAKSTSAHITQFSSSTLQPDLILDSLKLFQPESFGLPPFEQDC